MKTAVATKLKETEIGTIPETWDVCKLQDNILIKGRIGWKGLKKSEYLDSGYAIINGLQFENGDIDWKTVGRISKERYEESPEIMLKDGDILMTKDGTIGKLAYIKKLPEPATVASGVFVIRNNINSVIDQDFLFYYFQSDYFKNLVYSRIEGAVIPHLYQRDINELLVPIPPLNQQKQIAEIFSSLDDKIELNRKINANLENLAAALFKKWFVEIGDELPEGWKMGTFGEAITNFDSKRIPLSGREREKRQGSYPYYGATSIMDYVNDFIFDGTYVLLGEDGSVARDDGKPFIQYVHGKIWVNNHAHVLQGKNGFSTEYVKVFLDQVDIMPFVTGAVQPKLNQANMNSIPMVIPDAKTLTKFNEVLSGIFGMVLENEDQIKNLEKVRDSLLPRLMNGRIRIKI